MTPSFNALGDAPDGGIQTLFEERTEPPLVWTHWLDGASRSAAYDRSR